EHAARPTGRCNHHSRDSVVLSPAENDRRSRHAVRLPCPGANRSPAKPDVPLARQRFFARSQSMSSRIRTVLELIKFEHSVRPLRLAWTGASSAARPSRHGWPTLRQILWIVVAMVAARSAAMTMNRIADLRYDRENPRTNLRALATGALSLSFAWIFTL